MPVVEQNDALRVQSDDSNFRPFFQGVTAQDQTIATILLMSDNQRQQTNYSKRDTANYLSTFDKYVEQLIPTPTRDQIIAVGGEDTLPSGKLWVDTLDGFSPYYGIFNNFSLLNVLEGSDAIVKIHQNFSKSWNAFFFGDRPQIFTFSGLFIDSKEYPYYQEFMVAYEKILSGRKCIENNIVMKIIYDNKLISGYMMNIATTMEASSPFMKQFRFTVLVNTEPQWIRTNYKVDLENHAGAALLYEQPNVMDNTARVDRLLFKRTVQDTENG